MAGRGERRRVGSGGQRRRGLEGKGPTPPADRRPGHPAQRRAASAARRSSSTGGSSGGSRARTGGGGGRSGGGDVVLGRNPVVEALRVKVPATGLLVAVGIDRDDRVVESVALAHKAGVPVQEVPRADIDARARSAGGGAATHQGVALLVPEHVYADPGEVLDRALSTSEPPLVVVCDGVTDPRNLGAIVRSAAAFGAHGVVVRERRSAGVTAATWRTSAGAVARLPVARATNVTRTLRSYADAGLVTVGLAADGELPLDALDAAVGPLAVVVGSEGGGLSRLVGETCDLRVRIPVTGLVESLNASVATAVVLAEVARRRRAGM